MAYERSFDEPAAPEHNVCRHLRSKAIFVAGQMEPPAEMVRTGSGHCWCNWTQNVLGPDDEIVDRRACDGTRTCYEAVL